ncbi:cupin domain-containing protein [Thermodesulfobacteriota bacterium]
MHTVVNVDEIDFYKVAWGLTKNIIGPESAGSEKIKINITEYLPGYTHKLHVHPTQEEVIYVLSGNGVSETETGKIEVGPGSVAFVPAGTAHATQNLSSTESMTAIIIKSPPGDEEVKL